MMHGQKNVKFLCKFI